MNPQRLKYSKILKYIAEYSLVSISILLLVFSLLSGAEGYGGGFYGIMKNSPNAIPWLILLFITVLAWKRELIGGLIIIIFGIAMVYFFNFSGNNFFFVTFVFTLIIVFFGLLFVISWYLKRVRG